MSDTTTREPVMTISVFTSLLTAVLALIVTFGVNLTTNQTALIITIGAIVFKTVGAVIARSRVTPV